MRNAESEADWHKVFAPNIEIISEAHPNEVFVGSMDAPEITASFNVSLGVLTLPLKVRVSKNLVASNIDIRRKKENGALLTFQIEFTPVLECLKSHLRAAQHKALRGQLAPHQVNAEVERFAKLKSAKHIGRTVVTMYSKK